MIFRNTHQKLSGLIIFRKCSSTHIVYRRRSRKRRTAVLRVHSINAVKVPTETRISASAIPRQGILLAVCMPFWQKRERHHARNAGPLSPSLCLSVCTSPCLYLYLSVFPTCLSDCRFVCPSACLSYDHNRTNSIVSQLLCS